MVECLIDHHGINQGDLAQQFVTRYRAQIDRGYGGTAHKILRDIHNGVPWQEAVSRVFDGMGSMGNGAAMRAAPIGAYFFEDLPKVVEHATLSAAVTHAHPDGQAGAIAVAIAAAWACQTQDHTAHDLFDMVIRWTPQGDVQAKLIQASQLPLSYSIQTAVSALGNGTKLLASDTVPLSLWCVARHLDSYEEAIWSTVSALGDRDTTCAIVGGISVLLNGVDGIPKQWRKSRESISAL